MSNYQECINLIGKVVSPVCLRVTNWISVRYAKKKYTFSYIKNALLRYSSRYGYTRIVNLLIENGANVQFKRDISLVHACKCGHLEIARLLVINGANCFLLEVLSTGTWIL